MPIIVVRGKGGGWEKQFHEVKFGKASVAVPALSGLEIHYPSGVKVVFPAANGLDIAMLSALIKLSVWFQRSFVGMNCGEGPHAKKHKEAPRCRDCLFA